MLRTLIGPGEALTRLLTRALCLIKAKGREGGPVWADRIETRSTRRPG